LILGPEGEAFEHEFSQYVGAAHAVALSSGTSAIAVALRALEIGPGDEVITVSHTAVPTVGAICECGAVPRFVEIDERTLLIDPEQVAACIRPKTRAILVVHLYGAPAEMSSLLQVAARHHLAVIEDCAQAHGARICGQHVGTFGTVGCFSFYPTKNLAACGDGGLCITADERLARRMRQLRFHGFDEQRVAQVAGINSRLDEIQAAILRVRLARLNEALRARHAIAAQYRERLAATELRLPAVVEGLQHAWHLFVVRTARRAEITQRLSAAQIGYGIHYPRPVHLMPAYEHLGYRRGSLPVTERAAEEVLSLPLFPELTYDEVETVCRTLVNPVA
jgi:dTDP-4-amino-4,6-dideoxygalactose transaminase